MPTPSSKTKLWLLILLTMVAWSPSLRTASWTADDPEVLLQSPVITGALPLTEAFTRDYTYHVGGSGQWRPAAALSLRLDHSIHGASSSRGWHLTNILIHLATIALAVGLGAKLFEKVPWLGLAFFAVHPILSDSVAWASGRPSLLCALLGLTGATLFYRTIANGASKLATTAASSAALLLPLLAKEDGALFALLLVFIAAKHGPRVIALTLAGCAIGTSAWLLARGFALGTVLPGATEPVLAGATVIERAMTAFRVLAEALKLLGSPFGRPPSYELTTLPGLFASTILVACSAGVLLAAHRSKPIPSASWALPLLTLTPFLHLLPLGEVFAPRFVHLPLLFLIPLADDLLRRLVSPLPIAILITLTGATWSSTSNYKDAEAYWLASLHHAPASPVAWNALGLARAESGRHEEAIASFKAAIGQDPSHSRAWSNLARSLLATGRAQEAESALEAAVQTGPRNPIAHTNWGLHLERRGDHVGAREAFIRASLLRPGLPQAWAGIARTERRLGREAEASIAEQRARSLEPRRGN